MRLIAIALLVAAVLAPGCAAPVVRRHTPPTRGLYLLGAPPPPPPPFSRLRWHEADGEAHLDRDLWREWLRYMAALHRWRERVVTGRSRAAVFSVVPDPRPAERPPVSRAIGRLRMSF